MNELTQIVNGLYDSGMSCPEIAKYLGVDIWVVYSALTHSDVYHAMVRLFKPDEIDVIMEEESPA